MAINNGCCRRTHSLHTPEWRYKRGGRPGQSHVQNASDRWRLSARKFPAVPESYVRDAPVRRGRLCEGPVCSENHSRCQSQQDAIAVEERQDNRRLECVRRRRRHLGRWLINLSKRGESMDGWRRGRSPHRPESFDLHTQSTVSDRLRALVLHFTGLSTSDAAD